MAHWAPLPHVITDLAAELTPGRDRGLLLVSSEGQAGPTAMANLHQYAGLHIALESHDHHGKLLAPTYVAMK